MTLQVLGGSGESLPRGPALPADLSFSRPGARPTGLLLLALALLVVGQLGRIPVVAAGGKEAPLLVNDLAVLLFLAGSFLVLVREKRLELDGVALLGLLFAGIGGLSALVSAVRYGLSPFEVFFSLAYLGRWLVYFAVYVAVVNVVRDRDVPLIWKTLEGAVLVFAGFGILQSIFLPGFAQIVYPDAPIVDAWDYQGRRLVSTFLDPNFAGGLIAMILLVQGGLIAYGQRVSTWKLAVLFTALVFTLSRSSALALMVGSGVLVWGRGALSRRVARAALLLFLLVLVTLPVTLDYAIAYNKLSLDDPSALGRLGAWLFALRMFLDHPVLGVGFNAYGFVAREYGVSIVGNQSFGVEGGLLFITVLTGLVGLTVFGAMLLRALLRCRSTWRADVEPRTRGLALGVGAATVALVVHSLFSNSILYPFHMEVLYILWGLVFVAGHDEGSSREPARDAGAAAPRGLVSLP